MDDRKDEKSRTRCAAPEEGLKGRGKEKRKRKRSRSRSSSISSTSSSSTTSTSSSSSRSSSRSSSSSSRDSPKSKSKKKKKEKHNKKFFKNKKKNENYSMITGKKIKMRIKKTKKDLEETTVLPKAQDLLCVQRTLPQTPGNCIGSACRLPPEQAMSYMMTTQWGLQREPVRKRIMK
ncbi:PREDICTED: corepressor interacting with RBPJ 1-like, partial [Nestor notabilis]|uniref:corepressor interacting with RBPJ 1-like n=1 Tax=Nestor notabilis TaxID=176057 RepID=UPI000523CC20